MITMDDRNVKRAMKKLEREMKNPQRFLRSVAKKEIEKAEQRIMATKVDPDATAWQPWSYATAYNRQREGTAALGLLYRTGNLLRSFYSVITRRTAEIRNSAFYAKYLQLGTNDMPAREFFGWGRSSEKDLSDAAKKYFGRFWK